LLPNPAAECRNTFAIEIRFESVSHRFVQENSRPARPQHYCRFASRRIHRIELDDSLPRGFSREMLGRFFFLEKLERDTSAAA